MRASSEVAGGDLEYMRLGYQHQWYYPVTRQLTLLAGGELGAAGGIGGKPLPFFKNFYAGGPGTVRGYRSFSLRPQDANGHATGGNRNATGSPEVLLPPP